MPSAPPLSGIKVLDLTKLAPGPEQNNADLHQRQRQGTGYLKGVRVGKNLWPAIV